MKFNCMLTFVLAAIGAASAIVYFTRRVSANRRLVHVADGGYETAQDILFPGKRMRGRLHYGPVLPK